MRNNTFDKQSPMGLYFDSNAEGLLQNVILNTILGNPLGPDDYWRDFSANVGYESEGGYKIDLGYNKPDPLEIGKNLDWLLEAKIPINF